MIIFKLLIPTDIRQLLVICGQNIWVAYFPCTDAETHLSLDKYRKSHFLATQRHDQWDPVRVAQELMVQTHPTEVSPAVSHAQAQLTQNINAASNYLLSTLDSGREVYDCLDLLLESAQWCPNGSIKISVVPEEPWRVHRSAPPAFIPSLSSPGSGVGSTKCGFAQTRFTTP